MVSGPALPERPAVVSLSRENLWDIHRGKGRDARLFLPHLSWAHGLARDADDPGLLSQKIQRLGGFFGQADDTFRRESLHIITLQRAAHVIDRADVRAAVTAPDPWADYITVRAEEALISRSIRPRLSARVYPDLTHLICRQISGRG